MIAWTEDQIEATTQMYRALMHWAWRKKIEKELTNLYNAQSIYRRPSTHDQLELRPFADTTILMLTVTVIMLVSLKHVYRASFLINFKFGLSVFCFITFSLVLRSNFIDELIFFANCYVLKQWCQTRFGSWAGLGLNISSRGTQLSSVGWRWVRWWIKLYLFILK